MELADRAFQSRMVLILSSFSISALWYGSQIGAAYTIGWRTCIFLLCLSLFIANIHIFIKPKLLTSFYFYFVNNSLYMELYLGLHLLLDFCETLDEKLVCMECHVPFYSQLFREFTSRWRNTPSFSSLMILYKLPDLIGMDNDICYNTSCFFQLRISSIQ